MDVDDTRTPAEMVLKAEDNMDMILENRSMPDEQADRCEALAASWYQAAALTRIATALEAINRRQYRPEDELT